MANGMFVYRPFVVSHSEFVEFWEPLYGDKDRVLDDKLYTPNINGPHSDNTLLLLFKWKIGRRFFKTHLPKIRTHFLDRADDAARALSTDDPNTFLRIFPDGGAIYRIFWMHCWFPERFPIYDQNVHRAMIYIQEGRVEELTGFSDQQKIDSYLHKYIFFNSSFSGIDRRKVDRTLFAFGKFIKGTKFPLPT
jgi:hypothetical protein